MHLFELPIEIINQIFDFCTYGELYNVAQTSKLMYKIYKKYDEFYNKIKNDHNDLNDIILYIKKIQKSANREIKLRNISHIKESYISSDKIKHSIVIYIMKYCDISCLLCDKKKIQYIGNELQLIFCENCMIYICGNCYNINMVNNTCIVCDKKLIPVYYLD